MEKKTLKFFSHRKNRSRKNCSHAWNFHIFIFTRIKMRKRKENIMELNEDLYRNYGNKIINTHLHKNSIMK